MSVSPAPIVTHDARYPQAADHRCEPRILLQCCDCGRELPICNVVPWAVAQARRNQWHCEACEFMRHATNGEGSGYS